MQQREAIDQHLEKVGGATGNQAAQGLDKLTSLQREKEEFLRSLGLQKA
jgi:hypothetical protein